MPHGWTGQLLRVNLTAGSIEKEPLNMDWARQYIGGRGLGTRYLYEEIDPGCDALGPENKVIFATGPLTGTYAPTGGRYMVLSVRAPSRRPSPAPTPAATGALS